MAIRPPWEKHNIYNSTKSGLSTPIKTNELHETLVIAKRQKALLYTFLLYMLVGALAGVNEEIKTLVQLTLLPIALAFVIFTTRLSLKLYGTFGAILMAILSLVPLINVLVLLRVNLAASKHIQSSGFKVGMMGANIKKIAHVIEQL